nr:PREDICTED: protein msta-like isoform X2 [Bemisia tabaci]
MVRLSGLAISEFECAMYSDECRELQERLHAHLSANGCPLLPGTWTLGASPLAGRGVFAGRAFRAHEAVLCDAPLVVGPRTYERCPVVCVECGRWGPSGACPKGCLLPLCSGCAAAPSPARHRGECEYIRQLGPRGAANERYSRLLYKAVTPIRCLALRAEQRELVRRLQSNDEPRHSFEVDILKKSVEKQIEPEDEAFMRLCCQVMDVNAFETVALHEDSRKGANYESSLRGLYPLAAIMNHSCSPNIRIGFDDRQRMVARATRSIECGEEITTSYSLLLWGTSTRRSHLLDTKHFLCSCFRCLDPTELGTFLFMMDCPSRGCGGQLSPTDPLSLSCAWTCGRCNRVVTEQQISILRNIAAGPTPDPDLEDLSALKTSLEGRLGQVAVSLKLSVIGSLGHKPKYTWTELDEKALSFKKQLCEEVLQLLQSLQLGVCRLRAFS